MFNTFSKFNTEHWKQSKFLHVLVPHYEVLLDETLSSGFSISFFGTGQTQVLGGQILSFCIDFNAS